MLAIDCQFKLCLPISCIDSIDPSDKFKTIFTRLDVNDDKSHLLEFIETFDPCKDYCDHGKDLNFMRKCSNNVWGDGDCDDWCNSHQCQYDGGDWYVPAHIFCSLYNF